MSVVRRLFIDGVWREGSRDAFGTIVNPATEEAIGRVAHASAGDVECAIAAARDAFPRWRDTRADGRAAVLNAAADYVAERIDSASVALTREQGKTVTESRAEFRRVVETLRWHAGAVRAATEPRHDSRSAVVMPEPIGVVGAFTPWNYPAVIAARKLSAALAAGCSVVLKGAEEAPSAAVLIVEALEAAGLPAGVLNLVFGDPPTISAAVLDSPAVRAFSFTGSTAVGKQIAERAASGLKRCVLELGGHAPVLVYADADLDAAVKAIAAYKFECAGQSCNAPSRIYVEQPLYGPFVDRFAATAAALRIGDGMDPATDMGPMANPRRLSAMRRLTEDALLHGGRLITGGERLARPGYFWPPTVVFDVPDTAALMSEEPFGPIVPISPFSTPDEAIAKANANAYGLAAYVFTSSAETAAATSCALAAGSVGINSLAGVPPDVGIAGIKESGYGYEGGRLGIDAFLNLKVVRGIVAERRKGHT
jgi:succinate-semialdehyde dehydrogenase / glutarate-semialdehyde dehydrogenase